MQQTNPRADQRGKKSVLVAGLGAAFVSAGITFAIMSGSSTPSPSTTPLQAAAAVQATAPVQTPPVAQAAPPQAKSCQVEPRWEIASVENGGSGVVRFRAGDYVSPWVTLTNEPQWVVFPTPRPGVPENEDIVIEGQATNVVLGADHFVIPKLDGSYGYGIRWRPAKCQDQ
jgi:hypothetical protein